MKDVLQQKEEHDKKRRSEKKHVYFHKEKGKDNKTRTEETNKRNIFNQIERKRKHKRKTKTKKEQ